MQPTDPSHIGRYRLKARLGIGGMGQVYLARTPGGRPVVVKVIRPEYANDTGFRIRFTREVEAAHRVGGFHTAQVVDANTTAEEPWITSAYIPGPSLQQAVTAHGPLPESSLQVLAAGLAEGLEAVHEHGLVHRDLKPANIIMAEDGPRIIDFGIARPPEDTRITHSGALMGTPAYMAPEQAEGKLPEPAVDVFSLGTVLYFAATGTNPFQARTIVATLRLLIGPAPTIPDEVPENLGDLIIWCWNHDPAKRPALAEVIDILSEVDTQAWPPYPHASVVSAEVLDERFNVFRKLYNQSRYESALPGLEQLLPQYCQTLGDDHKDTLRIRQLIARCQDHTGRHKAAMDGFRQLLPDMIRVYGADHPHTLEARTQFYLCLGNSGKLQTALEAHQKLLPDMIRVYGVDHPYTLTIRAAINGYLARTGNLEAALEDHQQLLPDRARVLGPDHRHTLGTRLKIAVWTHMSGDTAKAVELFSTLVNDQTRVLGTDHSQTQASQRFLKRWQNELLEE
ncbi:serine/threonine-protein kinase [Nocardiopsis sp. JB363]|uniref:serine/threonine-protein kinase n=1 Tax=Nocardiopsis sp. JB363 TaxID=1434837 RepID=UPI0011804D85|nr:serine/threonine-protein kinase [Nocardiopsis sp. JB363]